MNKENKKSLNNIQKYTLLYEKYGFMLTKVQQQAFELYFYKDLSYTEVAEILATTRSSVYDAVDKAFKKLDKIQKQKDAK
ncbi:Sigma-70, region 4 [Mycoplasmopsis citelli]|uniref:Sigma-70, region 4 n=1 Tax=Mycoplasmopsis citelli TaxID=171281 RepID=A0A449B312_9BACT|nr:sigma factor-like helix-turn-helix DNA-binding protein [Mycoplasmopsis citelli]VEU74945.1 Sigma-70, region 4 [Mycoplasmopsis citelli]